jgi:hypothetical protein
MRAWQQQLRLDPLPALQSSANEAIAYLTRRDLLDLKAEPIEALWQLPAAKKILTRQLEDGAWRYPGGGKGGLQATQDYNQLETYRMLGFLVEKYGMNKAHPSIQAAAAFLFSRQTDEGDFRGIYGRQYTPNYSAGIMELLIKAGYETDPRIAHGFDWLLSVRQGDGGWAIPLSTAHAKWDQATLAGKTIPFDRSRAFSHMVTAIVLRAFAAHKHHRRSPEANAAGRLVASRFFLRDTYPGRQAPDSWLKFAFPFWFTDLLSALDSLSLIGFPADDLQ